MESVCCKSCNSHKELDNESTVTKSKKVQAGIQEEKSEVSAPPTTNSEELTDEQKQSIENMEKKIVDFFLFILTLKLFLQRKMVCKFKLALNIIGEKINTFTESGVTSPLEKEKTKEQLFKEKEMTEFVYNFVTKWFAVALFIVGGRIIPCLIIHLVLKVVKLMNFNVNVKTYVVGVCFLLFTGAMIPRDALLSVSDLLSVIIRMLLRVLEMQMLLIYDIFRGITEV